MSGHYLEIRANVNRRGAVPFLILGAGNFLEEARDAHRYGKALTVAVVRPESLAGPAKALAVTRGGRTTITFPAGSIRDVRMS